jgi:outer membrane protein assembly factor BamB
MQHQARFQRRLSRELLVWATIVLAATSAVAQTVPEPDGPEHQWPQWRGPLGRGVAPHADPPLKWSQSENIRWKTAVPGLGHSTPIVWRDRVFLTTAVSYGEAMEPRYVDAPGAHDNLPITHHYKFVVLAISRREGKILWERTLRQQLPHEQGHFTGSLASHSPITDGQRLWAFFGSRGLYCLDFDGKLLWKKDLGEMQTKHAHGEGSSPALHGDTLIINWDHEGRSFVLALDKRSGAERWKVGRDELTSWASPIVALHNGKPPQVVVSGTKRIRGYDLATGKVVWECGGLSSNIVASPVAADGMLFAGSSYEKQAMVAIRLGGAEGDITDTKQVAWMRTRGTPYVPSPLLYGDWLYFLRHYQGILYRVNAKTGDEGEGPIRLGDIRDVYASPVGAAGRVYITDRYGATVVLSHAEKPKVLGLNQLADTFSASPALVGRELFLRGQRFLYCIAAD